MDLQKDYREAFDYWTRLVPNRPRYAVLCNFDEFRDMRVADLKYFNTMLAES